MSSCCLECELDQELHRHLVYLLPAADPLPGTDCPSTTVTVGPNIQLLWEQADFDFTVGEGFVSDENSAC